MNLKKVEAKMRLSWKQRMILVLLMAALTGGTFTCHSSSNDDDDTIHVHSGR